MRTRNVTSAVTLLAVRLGFYAVTPTLTCVLFVEVSGNGSAAQAETS